MANCPQCNTPYDAGAIFCDNCGASLAAPMPQAVPPMPVYAPPPVAPMSVQPAPPVYPPATGGVNCAQCGTPLGPNAAFCDNCGAPVTAAPVLPSPMYTPPPQQPPVYPPQPPAYPPQPAYSPAPRLIVQATNVPIPLQPGKTEYIVGREDPVSNVFPDVDLTPYGGDEGGVSRHHARLFQQGGQWFVEDYNSTNFTFVNTQRVQPNVPLPVPGGAELRFGRVKLLFYM